MHFFKIVYFLFLIISSFNSFASMGNCAFTKGAVTLTRNNLAIPLTKGATIEFGDFIQVGNSSITVLTLKNATIKLESNTQLKIEGNINSHDTSLDIDYGTLVIHKVKNYLRNNRKPSFKVQTKYASMGIRGTLFFVYQGTKPQTTLSVNNGVVTYKAASSSSEIKVTENLSTMSNINQKNLRPRLFGFEKNINYNLDYNSELSSSPELISAIEKSWEDYKKEQEYLWQTKKDDDEKIWENWKQENI